jgi:hypothetical protein
VEQQLSAGLREGQIAEFVKDDEVETGEEVSKPSLSSGAPFGLETVDQVDCREESPTRSGANAASCDGDRQMISYRLPRLFLGQLRLSARCRRRAFLISAGMLNRSAMMALPSAVVIGLPVVLRNS